MKKQKVKINRLLGLLMFASLIIMSGCQHSLNVKNIDEYSYIRSAPLKKNLSIGLMTQANDGHCEVLAEGISNSLIRYSSDIRVLNSFSNANEVDIIADVSITPNYKGSGWNFLINFPGFLVFAPAWNGYIYKVSYDINVQLINSSNLETVDSFDLPIDLDIRHADLNRTWTNGAGWLIDYGASAFVGGLFFTQYDKSVSPLLMNDLKVTVASHVAQKIVDRVNRSRKLIQFTKFHAGNSSTAFADFKMGH